MNQKWLLDTRNWALLNSCYVTATESLVLLSNTFSCPWCCLIHIPHNKCSKSPVLHSMRSYVLLALAQYHHHLHLLVSSISPSLLTPFFLPYKILSLSLPSPLKLLPTFLFSLPPNFTCYNSPFSFIPQSMAKVFCPIMTLLNSPMV